MKSIAIFLLLSSFIGTVNAQVKVKFVNNSTKQAIPQVVCMYKDIEIAQSNKEGICTLPKTKDNIEVMANGYEPKVISTGLEDKTVYLIPKSTDKSIKEVVIKVKEDAFAKNLIQKMIEQKDFNNASNLPSFKQHIYSKVIFDRAPIDTFKHKLKDSTKKKTDIPLDTSLENYLAKNVLFVWERVFENKHDLNLGDKTIILSSKMSGIKNPIYEALAEMYVGNRYPTIFNTDFYQKLVFNFEDSLVLNKRKTYVLSFYTKKKFRSKRSPSGTLYIDSATYILTKYIGTNLNYYVEYQNIIVSNKYYTHKFYSSQKMSNIQISDNQGTMMQITSNTTDFVQPYQFDKNEIKGNVYEISKDLSHNQSDAWLSKYRQDSMDMKELNTYKTLDTMKGIDDLNNKLRLLLAIRSGNLKFDKFDLNLFKLIDYNGYEGLRLGANLHTNSTWSTIWAMNSKVAYGFKDQKFKYELGGTYLQDYESNSKFSINWIQDVLPIGKASLGFEPNKLNLSNIFYSNYYKMNSLQAAYSRDLTKNSELKLGADWLQQDSTNSSRSNLFGIFQAAQYQYLSPNVALHWYPKSNYMTTPEGKFLVEKKPTDIYFNIKSGIGMNASSSNFVQFNSKFYTAIKSKLGNTAVTLTGGALVGNSPIFNAFEGGGVSPVVNSLLHSFGLMSQTGFMTMNSGRFYSDKQGSIFINHSILNKRFLKQFVFNPHLRYSATLGSNSMIPNVVAPTKLYQEVGLEFNDLIFGFGVGAYYRVGAYNTGVFSDNFAVRLTSLLF